jgi:hypothetical protein
MLLSPASYSSVCSTVYSTICNTVVQYVIRYAVEYAVVSEERLVEAWIVDGMTVNMLTGSARVAYTTYNVESGSLVPPFRTYRAGCFLAVDPVHNPAAIIIPQ